MSTPQKKRGLAELRDARRESRALYWKSARNGIFSFFAFNRWNQLRSAALGDQLKSADPDQNTAPLFAIRDAWS